jgi:CHAT domain-containing protein
MNRPLLSEIRSGLPLFLCLGLWLGASRGFTAEPRGLSEEASRAFETGAFSEAAALWEKALELARAKSNGPAERRAALSLAGAYQAVGQHRRAAQLLEETLSRAESTGDARLVATIQHQLGGALTLTRETDRAEILLRGALASAKSEGDEAWMAAILNDLGNLQITQADYPAAMASYDESAVLARRVGLPLLLAQALCNGAAAAVRAGEFDRGDDWNARAIAAIESLPDSHRKGFLFLTAGLTDRDMQAGDAEATKRVKLRAHRSFGRALAYAEAASDRTLETYALGYLGGMYAADAQLEAALRLSQRAAFVAQQAQRPEMLYRWEAQIGRIQKARGESEAATATYRRAIQNLQAIRQDISLGNGNAPSYRSFRETEGPLFLELADLLIEKSKRSATAAEEQGLLLEAREVVEQMKSVEMEAYFCDDCVDVLQSKKRAIESVDPETAVVYLVSLPDRIEILIGLTSGLRRFTAAVGADELASTVREFRRNLETRTTYGFLTEGQQLYDWLIRPIHPFLREHGVSTLVFVPDGAIRTIPFASLHDGEKFLIQDLAVAVAPGLSMVDPQPIASRKARMLLNGVSESVQGFAALDFVHDELRSIEATYPSETLLNRSFTLSALQDKLANDQFSIVHIASHGQFNRDVRKTFVLTHDSKLTLNDLEALIRPSQYRGRPVELLVLSACQTAAGDDRAALGLAGVALKAGARSALATLWFVNDQSTSALVSEVYRQLQRTPRVSKARALQAAQLKLMDDRRYRHPCYWSPYLVIGNWL